MIPKQAADPIRELYPGTPVPISGTLVVTVYPAGFRHIQKFSRAVVGLLQRLSQLGLTQAGDGTYKLQDGIQLGPIIAEILVSDLLELVDECCVPKLGNLPHWHLADVLVAWIGENFGEEARIRPWVRAIEMLVQRTTGHHVDLWETFSKLLSPSGIEQMTSSIRSNLGGHTVVGASPSSGSGASPVPLSEGDSAQSPSPT